MTDIGIVRLDDEEAVKRVLVDTLFGLWASINTLTRLRPTKRERFRVTIFGSARTEQDHWVYQEVKRVAADLAAGGWGRDRSYGRRVATPSAEGPPELFRPAHTRGAAPRSDPCPTRRRVVSNQRH
jgi:hypothetical protein